MRTRLNVKTIAISAVMLSLSLIIGTIETLLPPIVPILPYFRLGLSNLVVLLAILICGPFTAAVVTIGKSILVPLFLGNVMMIAYSLPAALTSFILAFILLKVKKLGLPSISALCAIAHNLVQLCVAALITASSAVFAYFPLLGLLGAASGAAIGFITWMMLRYLPEKLLF